MQHWEYKIVHVYGNGQAEVGAMGKGQQMAQETLIDQLGSQGWELVGVMSGTSTGQAMPSVGARPGVASAVFGTLYFKRPKP